MIKKIKIELSILVLLLVSIFISNSIDFGFYNFFNNSGGFSEGVYVEDFFKQITVLGDSKWYFVSSFFVIICCYFVSTLPDCARGVLNCAGPKQGSESGRTPGLLAVALASTWQDAKY